MQAEDKEIVHLPWMKLIVTPISPSAPLISAPSNSAPSNSTPLTPTPLASSSNYQCPVCGICKPLKEIE